LLEVDAATKSTWKLSPNVINELRFRYEYDRRGRMIAKKIPDAGWTYMGNDKHDRSVFTQEANMHPATRYILRSSVFSSSAFPYSGGRVSVMKPFL